MTELLSPSAFEKKETKLLPPSAFEKEAAPITPKKKAFTPTAPPTLETYGNVKLTHPAMNALKYAESVTGFKIPVTSSARTYTQQKALYAKDPAHAATPGFSPHEKAIAIDINVKALGGVGSEKYKTVRDALKSQGFELLSEVAKTKAKKEEVWHFTYKGKKPDVVKPAIKKESTIKELIQKVSTQPTSALAALDLLKKPVEKKKEVVKVAPKKKEIPFEPSLAITKAGYTPVSKPTPKARKEIKSILPPAIGAITKKAITGAVEPFLILQPKKVKEAFHKGIEETMSPEEKKFIENHPYISGGAEMAGGVMPYGVAFSGTHKLFKTLSWFNKLSPLAQRYVVGTATMAGIQGLEEKSAIGLLKGGLTGAAYETLFAGAGKVVEKGVGKMIGRVGLEIKETLKPEIGLEFYPKIKKPEFKKVEVKPEIKPEAPPIIAEPPKVKVAPPVKVTPKPEPEAPPTLEQLITKKEAKPTKPKEKVKPLTVEAEPVTIQKEKEAILDTDEFPVQKVPVEKIKSRPKDFQFKLDVNATGEQKPLKGEFDVLKAGNVLLWESKEGELYIANGHHRLEHAKRRNKEFLNSQILKESDGYSVDDARRIAAETNIGEGRGTIYDHAEYFRLEKGYTESLAEKKGLKGQGYAIGKLATDNTYTLFRSRKITPEHTEAIASSAPNNDALQLAGANFSLKNPKAEPYEIENFVHALKLTAESSKLKQEGMFAFDDSALKDAEKKAKIVSKMQSDIREQINAVRGSAKRPEIAKRLGVDVKDPEGVNKKVSELLNESERLKKWYLHSDIVRNVEAEVSGIKLKPEPAQEPKVATVEKTPSGYVLMSEGEQHGGIFETENAAFGYAKALNMEVTRPPIRGETGRVKEGLFGAEPEAELFAPVTEKPAVPKMEAVSKELDAEVNAALEDISPPVSIGMSTRITKSPVKREPYKFVDDATETRFNQAKTRPEEHPATVVLNSFRKFVNNWKTEFEGLPREPKYAPLRNWLLQLQKKKGVVSFDTVKKLQGITINLDTHTKDLFERKIVLDDLLVYVERQIKRNAKIAEKTGEPVKPVKLPFGLTERTLPMESNRINAEILKYPEVVDAVSKRGRLWGGLRDSYSEAMGSIGFDVTDILNNPNYFRHNVLDYANMTGIWGTGKKLKTPTGRGFLKKRTGSELDYLTEYISAEHEVVAQMMQDIEIAKVIKNVETSQYNISHKLKQKAKHGNYVSVVGGIDNYNTIKRLEGELREIYSIPKEEIDSGIRQEAKFIIEQLNELDPTRIFKQRIAMGFNELEKLGIYGSEDALIDEGTNIFKAFSRLMKEEGEHQLPIATIFKAIKEREEFIRKLLGEKYHEWKYSIDERLIPENHNRWQPREGSSFFMADSIPNKVAEQLLKGELESIGITKEQLRKVLAKGRRFPEMVLPDEVINVLNNLGKPPSDSTLSNAMRNLTTVTKQWLLLSPRKFLRYNFRNITGDADPVFIGNPRAFLKVKQAVSDLTNVFISKKAMPDRFRKWFEMGGMQTTLAEQEIKTLVEFENLFKRNPSHNVWKQYWSMAKTTSNFREAILRYANYLEYVEQMSKSPTGRPLNWGASNRREIMALPTIQDRAFWMSNELLGAYDMVSVNGQWVRENLIPFWSWKETNTKRLWQLIKNAAEDGKTSELIGRKFLSVGARSPFIAYNIGKVALKGSALWATTQAWNNLRHPEEEKEIPESVRSRPHLTLGRDENGKVMYFSRIGAIGDFLELFGLDAPAEHVDNYFKGRKNLVEIAKDMGKSPVNSIWKGISPLYKSPFELVTGRATFPDVSKPRVIRQRDIYVAQQLGLENEYRQVFKLPHRPYSESLKEFIIYKADPEEIAYNEVMSAKYDFFREQGRGVDFVTTNAKGLALYNYKIALRMKDRTAAEKYLSAYMKNGGMGSGIKRSMDMLNPSYGLKYGDEFFARMDDKDKIKFQRAKNYWHKTFKGGRQ